MTRKRDVNLLAQSPQIRAMHAERRGLIPTLLPEECEVGPEVVIPAEELADLKIDETYQRAEVESQVNELTHVLMSGGIIPDPVSIAVRPDKSRYIVDGQQRYWAHLDTGKPMAAKLYFVRDRNAELKLFDALNHSVALSGATRIKAWPGAAREVLQMLDDRPESAIRARLGWSGQVKSNYPVSLVLRGLAATLSGTVPRGDTRGVLTLFDAHYAKAPKWGKRACFTYAELLSAIFPETTATNLRTTSAIALGRTAHLRWSGLYEGESQAWPFPSGDQIVALQKLNWDSTCLSSSTRWVQPTQEAIEAIWTLPRVLKMASGGAR